MRRLWIFLWLPVVWTVGRCYLKARRTYFEDVRRAVEIVYVLHRNDVKEGELAPLDREKVILAYCLFCPQHHGNGGWK